MMHRPRWVFFPVVVSETSRVEHCYVVPSITPKESPKYRVPERDSVQLTSPVLPGNTSGTEGESLAGFACNILSP